jgi:hypothetical protein
MRRESLRGAMPPQQLPGVCWNVASLDNGTLPNREFPLTATFPHPRISPTGGTE